MTSVNNDFIINADGTITRTSSSSSSSGGSQNRGSTDNSGCGWGIFIIICVIVGIIIAVVFSNNSHHQEPETQIPQVVSLDDDDEYAEVEQNKATYLNLSQNSVTFDAKGGSVDIDIDANGDWEIGTPPNDWGHVSKYISYIRLRVDRNSGNEDRTDWFSIKAGDLEKRIDIKQYANTKPSANIERVWMDHNVFYNGKKGMMIHVTISVENLQGQTVHVYAYFYQADNSTPLHDYYNNNLYFYGTGNVHHDPGRFDDLKIFVPYTSLNMAPGTSGTFSFDIAVKHGGNQLDRNNNNQFTFSNM